MHKTSSQTFIYKYIFAPVWLGSVSVAAISIWSTGGEEWAAMQFALMLAVGLIWLIPMMLMLRSAEANEHHLLIKKIKGTQIINYADIEYVSQPLMVNPKLISIRYTDRESGTSENILLMPSRSSYVFKFDMFGELDMTRFLRQQILKYNPNFTREAEPSRWKLFAMIMATVAVMLLILFLLLPTEF